MYDGLVVLVPIWSEYDIGVSYKACHRLGLVHSDRYGWRHIDIVFFQFGTDLSDEIIKCLGLLLLQSRYM